MEKLTIYLGDLTHDTIGLATETFPLNIGYVASYANKLFPQQLELRLFKSIQKLHEAILSSPPDVLALSNYPWCHNIGLATFEILKQLRPEAIRVMGGPNFPHRRDLQEEYLRKRPLIDIHIYLDGEVPFTNLVSVILGCESLLESRNIIKNQKIKGCVYLDVDQRLAFGATPVRITDLDEIPSPYLGGFLDEFFDGRLSPIIQTNRGCPFSCTYCADGTSLVDKINKFTVQRVKDELTYIGERIKPSNQTLIVADLNYGMYVRDKEISEHIASIQEKYNYPRYLSVSIGKNSKTRVVENIEILNGASRLGMSVQSLDENVLRNIKRDNLRLTDYMELMPKIIDSGLSTSSEVILGLPGDTREAHLSSLCQLIDRGIDNVFAYTLMLLHGSELYTPEQIEMWEFKTNFRVIPRDFTWVNPLEKGVVEIEEVVVGSNSLTFEDYVYCRQFVLLVNLVSQDGYKAVNKWLREIRVGSREVLENVLTTIINNDLCASAVDDQNKLNLYFKEYEKFTREELWENEEEISNFFAGKENFSKLVRGEYGINCLQTFRAKIWANAFAELTETYFHEIEKIILTKRDEHLLEEFNCLKNYCQGKTFEVLSPDRLSKQIEFSLKYDVEEWLRNRSDQAFGEFMLLKGQKCRFVLTQAQYDTLEKSLDLFGRNELGLGKALIRIPVNTLYRNCQQVTQ